jgi:hypothetical protein
MADMNELSREDLLKEVNNAIYAITVGGQSYKIGSRSLTRANLTELKNLRAELKAEEAAESENGVFSRTYTAVFDGR